MKRFSAVVVAVIIAANSAFAAVNVVVTDLIPAGTTYMGSWKSFF